MKEELKILFNLGYLCGKSNDEKTKNLQCNLTEICEQNPDPIYSEVFKKGLHEGKIDRSHTRLNELGRLNKSKGMELER